jgi:hypothetical protein
MNKENCNWSIIWDYTKWETEHRYKNSYYTQKDWNQLLLANINMISARVNIDSFIGGANKIIVPFKFKKLFETLDYYNNSHNTLSSRYKVYFVDSNENVIYIYRDLYYEKIQSVPFVTKGGEDEMSEVTFKHVSNVTNEEIENYRRKLCGCIEIINYPVESETRCKITVSIEKVISENIKELIEKHLTHKHPSLDENIGVSLSKTQTDVLFTIENNHRTIVRKDRQVGMSSLLNAMIACKLVKDEPIKILFYSPKREMNHRTKSAVRENTQKLINDLGLKLKFVYNNADKLTLSNGNSIEYHTTNESTCFSLYTVDINKNDWVIFDEIAFGDRILPLYRYIRDRFNDPKITIVSTQAGLDDVFFPIYLLGKKAGYATIDARWVDAHELLKDNILKKGGYNQKMLFNEFSGFFVVNNAEKLNYDTITELIKPHLLSSEKFSLLELVDFIQKRIMVSDEINLR